VKKTANSGQIFILAILTITLVLLSTEVYVYETTSQTVNSNSDSLSDFVFMTKLGYKHTIISSLANVSVGGSASVLSTNLETLDSVVETQYQFGKCLLNYTLRNTSPYSNGVWRSWGSSGIGISGAYANFTFKTSDREVNATVYFVMNITTTVSILGAYQRLTGNNKQINIICNLFNEGTSALAKNITTYYKVGNNWFKADSSNNYSVTNYGNGTYSLTFRASILGSEVTVSTKVYDTREIFVRANTTCTRV